MTYGAFRLTGWPLIPFQSHLNYDSLCKIFGHSYKFWIWCIHITNSQLLQKPMLGFLCMLSQHLYGFPLGFLPPP